MREPTIVCAVLDCRRTGRPTFGRPVFICTKHFGSCESKDLTEYAHDAGARRAAEAREARGGRPAGHERILEGYAWARLVAQIKAKHAIKPGVELV